MSDINEFIERLGDDIGKALAPRIQEDVERLGDGIAAQAAPRVHDFANLLAPRMQEFANQLVKDIFAQQSGAIRDMIIGLVKDLVGRYDPALVGNLRTRIVENGIELASEDIRLEMKERATGGLVAALDLPVHFRVNVDEMFVKLDSATIRLDNVNL
jgi:hypothetical protein